MSIANRKRKEFIEKEILFLWARIETYVNTYRDNTGRTPTHVMLSTTNDYGLKEILGLKVLISFQDMLEDDEIYLAEVMTDS